MKKKKEIKNLALTEEEIATNHIVKSNKTYLIVFGIFFLTIILLLVGSLFRTNITPLSIPTIEDIFFIASIISFLLGTFGSISLLYGVNVTWNNIGLSISFNNSIIGIGFFVQNNIKSTSEKFILLIILG